MFSMTWSRAFTVGLPFAFLGTLQIAPYLLVQEQTIAGAKATAKAHELRTEMLGELPPAWQISSTKQTTRNESHSEGHFSTTFEIAHSNGAWKARLSLDYPFVTGWHHLTGCYTVAGWQCVSEEVVEVGSYSDWPFVKAKLRNVEGDEATLFFSLFNESATGLKPPAGELALAIWQRFEKTKSIDSLPTYFQVQLFTPGAHDAKSDKELLELFLLSREQVRRFVTSGPGRAD
jgi:hypothetical protein